jgi:hypothetical protein
MNDRDEDFEMTLRQNRREAIRDVLQDRRAGVLLNPAKQIGQRTEDREGKGLDCGE